VTGADLPRLVQASGSKLAGREDPEDGAAELDEAADLDDTAEAQ
jgi:hypothetical protein